MKSFKQIAIDQSNEAPRRIDVRDYLGEVLLSLQPLTKRTALAVEMECPEGLEITTYAGALYQIVMNLVVNSVTHGYDADQPGTLRLQVSRDDEQVVLSYSDDGRGMTPEVAARVFEPFFTTRRGSGGTGLGMHICYNLVTQRLLGTIRCASRLESGVRFDIAFPIQAGGQRGQVGEPRSESARG